LPGQPHQITDRNLRIERVEFRGTLALGNRFVQASLKGKCHAELIVGEGIIRIERECTAELSSSWMAFSAAALAFGFACAAVKNPSL
jgi:hypothetical protein